MDSTIIAALIGGAVAIITAIISAWVALTISRRKDKPAPASGSPVTVSGDMHGGTLVGGSGNIVTILTEGVDRATFDRAQSEYYNNQGRERVRAWATGPGWDWHKLGQALDYYADAIRHDRRHKHPWINMAYVCHLIGAHERAQDCLAEALKLAPGDAQRRDSHYYDVWSAVSEGRYLTQHTPVQRPPLPDWFRQRYAQYL